MFLLPVGQDAPTCVLTCDNVSVTSRARRPYLTVKRNTLAAVSVTLCSDPSWRNTTPSTVYPAEAGRAEGVVVEEAEAGPGVGVEASQKTRWHSWPRTLCDQNPRLTRKICFGVLYSVWAADALCVWLLVWNLLQIKTSGQHFVFRLHMLVSIQNAYFFSCQTIIKNRLLEMIKEWKFFFLFFFWRSPAISLGFTTFGWDFCVCDLFLIQPLR